MRFSYAFVRELLDGILETLFRCIGLFRNKGEVFLKPVEFQNDDAAVCKAPIKIDTHKRPGTHRVFHLYLEFGQNKTGIDYDCAHERFPAALRAAIGVRESSSRLHDTLAPPAMVGKIAFKLTGGGQIPVKCRVGNREAIGE